MDTASEIAKLYKRIEDLEKTQCLLAVALIQCSDKPTTAIELLRNAAAGDANLLEISERGKRLFKDIVEIYEDFCSKPGDRD